MSNLAELFLGLGSPRHNLANVLSLLPQSARVTLLL